MLKRQNYILIFARMQGGPLRNVCRGIGAMTSAFASGPPVSTPELTEVKNGSAECPEMS